MTVTASINSQLSASLTETTGLSSLSVSVPKQVVSALTGCDAVFAAAAELTAAAISYDLVGSLTDPLKNAVTFASLLGLYIANTGDLPLTIGGANNIPLLTGSTDKINLPAGASLVMIVDLTIAASTADLLTINSLVAAWEAGTYSVGTIRRHNSVLYQVIDEVETALEPGVSEGWAADWDVIDNESYELILFGIQPE